MLLEQQRWAIIQREHPPTAVLLLDATIDRRTPHDDDDDDDDDDDCIDDDDQDVVSATTAASSATTAVADVLTKVRVRKHEWGSGIGVVGVGPLWRLSMIASWVCEARQGGCTDDIMPVAWFEFSEILFLSLWLVMVSAPT